MPLTDTAQAFVDGRLKLTDVIGCTNRSTSHHLRYLNIRLHQEIKFAQMGVETEGTATTMMTVGLQAPEAVELSWRMEDTDLFLQGRTDRLFARQQWVRVPFGWGAKRSLWSWIGVQSDGFGAALLNATIDNEYKPGVDALRVGDTSE